MTLIRTLTVLSTDNALKFNRTGNVFTLIESSPSFSWSSYFAVGDTLVITGTTTSAYSNTVQTPYLITDISGTVMTVTDGNTANWASGLSSFQSANLNASYPFWAIQLDEGGMGGEFATGVIETELSGGLSRRRKAFVGTYRQLDISFTLDYYDWIKLLSMFYNAYDDDVRGLDEGVFPFYAYMSDRQGMTNKFAICYIIANTMKWDGLSGDVYRASCKVQVL